MKAKIYFPGLDGLRGIAAILVLIGHMLQFRPLINLEPSKYKGYGDLAQMAVTFFFVLSGFLITYLLLKEKEKLGTVKVRLFYLRRILRIWPLYFLIILISFSFYFFTDFFVSTNPMIFLSLLLYCFGLANLVLDLHIGLTSTDPLWSIGVEEQFYFFWPLLIRKFTAVKFVIICVIAGYIFVKFCIVGIYYFSNLPAKSFLLSYINHFRIDCMAIGGLGAYYVYRNPAIFNKLTGRYIGLLLVAFITALLVFEVKFSVLNYEVYSVLFLALILNVSIGESSLSFLKGRALVYLGKLSFGMYMYHMLVISVFHYLFRKGFISENEINRELLFDITIPLGTFLVAILSYEFFEKKILLLKDKYAVVKSGNLIKVSESVEIDQPAHEKARN